MADPRTFTVKQCPPSYAARSANAIASATSTRRDFFNSVGKIGDLEVLNSVGGGSIGRGLRNLASISNSIRTGCGSLPTAIGSSVDAGARWVLEQTGIAPAVIDTLRTFNPGIANQAYSQAVNIYDKIKQGNFKPTDIPGHMQDLQNAERLARNIFTPGQHDAQASLGGHCEASPYAMDMIARAPKFKYLFIVEFKPSEAYMALAGRDLPILEMAFTVKKSTRPSVKFQTEDVNYYNYRSAYITKTTFDEMTMTFHDDNRNLATEFYTAYMRAVSPITNIDPTHNAANSSLLEQEGMAFFDDNGNALTSVDNLIANQIPGHRYAGSSGSLAPKRTSTGPYGANSEHTVFDQIRLYHVYDYGNSMTVYNFTNPRIVQLSPDDVDMSAGSEGSELSITFKYDSVYVDPAVDLKNSKYQDIVGKQPGALYPLRYNGQGMPGGPNSAGINPYGVTTPSVDSCDPLNTTSNGSAGLPSGSAAVPAAGDLFKKFSGFI